MRFLKYFFLFLVITIGIVPVVVKFAAPFYLENSLAKAFSVKVSINSVQLNVFTGKVGIEGVHIYGENNQSFHLGQLLLDLDIVSLLEGRFFIESILLKNAKTDVMQLDNAWVVGGMHFPLANDESSEKVVEGGESAQWPFGIGKVLIENVGAVLNTKVLKSELTIEAFSFGGAAMWRENSPSPFDLQLNINTSLLTLSGDVKPFSSAVDFNALLEVNNLSIAPLISAIESDLPYNDIQAMLNTKMQLSYAQNKQEKNIILNGLLDVSGISLIDFANNLYIKEEKVHWDGRVAVTVTDDSISDISSLSTLVFSPLWVESTDTGILLGQFNRLAINNIRLDALNKIQIDEILVQQLVGMKDLKSSDAGLVSVGNMRFGGLKYDSQFVSIEEVDVIKLQANIVVSPKGELQVLAQAAKTDVLIQKSNQEGNKKDIQKKAQQEISEDNIEVRSAVAANESNISVKEKAEEKNPIAVRLGKLRLHAGSGIKIADYSVVPVFETEVKDIDLQIENIDTGNDSAWANMTLLAGIDDYGRIAVKGKAQPFSPLINAKATVVIDNLALVPLSSYAGKYAGLFIKRGSLSSNAIINVVDDKLNVKNKFKLNKLKLEASDTEISKSWMADMPMPLDLTLNVLRDKNDIIELEIPIEGLVSDPDFHLQDIYNKAMLKALKFAAKYYITQAVQPLGLVMTAGKLVGKAAQPRFEPFIFEPGSAELSSGNKKNLKKIAKLIADRPKLSLTVCAISAESDWQKMKTNLLTEASLEESKQSVLRINTLLKLANERSKLVKRYIVDASKTNPSRIQACNSKVDQDVKAVPVIVLSL